MTILLNISNLRMQFGGLVAVDDVNFTLNRGQIAAIIGPNGAGKTTVFNCVSGFYKPTRGNITLGQLDITGKGSHFVARAGLTRTFQNIRLFKKMSVLENLLVARHRFLERNYLKGIFKTPSFLRSERYALQLAKEWLAFFHLSEVFHHNADALSYGQQRRLEMARCMMTEPKVIILDEPAAGLNPNETAQLMEFIRRLRDEHGVSVLLIEHDMALVMRLSENIMVMEYGRPIAYGTPKEIQQNERVIKAYLGEE